MRECAFAFRRALPGGALALRLRSRNHRLVGLLDQRSHPGAAAMVLSAHGGPSPRTARPSRARLVRASRSRLRRFQLRRSVRSFMAIFITGSTGYLGSYLVAGLLREHRDALNLLVRAKSNDEARERLWQSLQLHFEFPEFLEYLNSRVHIFRGELTSECFGRSDDVYRVLVDSNHSLIHCAASLNRKSEKQCLNVNLRGGL